MFKSQKIKDANLTKEMIAELKVNEKALSIQLLKEYFETKQMERGQDPNFIQMKIFLNILNELFSNFEKCFFFSLENIQFTVQDMTANGLGALTQEYQSIRLTVMESILMTV